MYEKSFNNKDEHHIRSSYTVDMSSTLTERQKWQSKRTKQTHCLNLLKLSFAALPTIVFGIFTIVFTLQQNASAKATREQDQRQADEINRRTIFKEYIDDMKEILNEDFEQNINKSLLQIRIQTLTVLKHLDSDRKHDIILFLYENNLIRRDQSSIVDLRGANLNGMKFIKSSTEVCDFPYLYIPGVYAENIIFNGCSLPFAVFNSSSMAGAKFDSCNLGGSSFLNANLTKARFHDNHLYEANFNGAYLSQSTIEGGVFQHVDLTNTDLYQSDINDHLLYPMMNGGIAPNIFLNTRYPNGSFSNINTDNLIINGQAQSQCHLDSTSSWLESPSGNPIKIMNKNQINSIEMSIVKDDCFFRIEKNTITARNIILQNFSLLIDLEQAMFNFSAMFGLKSSKIKDEILMVVHFAQDIGSFDYARSTRSQ